MAFTVQNDEGTVDSANSYIEVDYADDYFTDRNNTTWVALTTTIKQSSLIAATDFVDKTFIGKFKGIKLLETQTTEWPRNNVYDNNGYYIEGIPEKLKKAICEYAYRASSSQLDPDPEYDDYGMPIESYKNVVGPITEEIKFQSGFYTPIRRRYPAADNLLKDLLIPGSGKIKFIMRS